MVLAILMSMVVVLPRASARASAVCVVGIPLEKLVNDYELIFEGEVIEVRGEVELPFSTSDGGVSSWKGLPLRMQIRKVWRGEPDRRVEIVYTHHAQDIHGRFHKGDRFIVWASQRNGRWLTGDCAPTIESDRASAGMRAFLDRLRKHDLRP